MARELFGDVTRPSLTVGTRKWYSVPLSILAHTSILGALVVAPLIATGVLPEIASGPLVINLAPPPLPTPPPGPASIAPRSSGEPGCCASHDTRSDPARA